ncbi:TniB protein [Rhodovulum sp. ES.010]|uniref:TniB family NTP-binding protein n=1 Tax=Rhodovulum sp. ES.010 TaxID=1882821 RepID=UPI00092C16E0|nr:TniB family NTP-binding protein [Rhodovulum sp. ES.010]SIO39422.1 TniB protein [Rhodovulum sp. ES.010]
MIHEPNHAFMVDEIVDDLKALYVRTDVRDGAVKTHLDHVLRKDEQGNLLAEPIRFARGKETRGIIVVDGSGGGKTTIIERALEKLPALQAAGEEEVPSFLKVTVPSPATLKSLGQEVLEVLGYPGKMSRATSWDIWATVRRQLANRGTAVVWIDEANHLFRSENRTEIQDILNTLKSLMQGKHPVIVVLSGIAALWEIVAFDAQITRRFSKLEFPPVTQATDGLLFRSIVETLCARAGIEPPEAADLVGRLMHASRYRFGRCIDTTIMAIKEALLEGHNRLDLQHFAEYWARTENCAPEKNVFLVPNWSRIELEPEEKDEPGVAKKSRARRGR